MKKKLMVIGAGGHGKVVADIAEKSRKYSEILFFDDNTKDRTLKKYKIVGKSSDVINYDGEVIVAIGNQTVRKELIEFLGRNGCTMATLIHPSAIISEDVEIGVGTVVMAGAIINCGTKIGKGCIINTASSVDHDCQVGDYVHISVGVHLAGTVEVGDSTHFGVGSIVSNNIYITSDCVIGAGAVVVKDINISGIYKGVPAILEK